MGGKGCSNLYPAGPKYRSGHSTTLLLVGLVINHQNQHAHVSPLILFGKLPVRGRTMVNSVNCPGSVSTSIVPPCCFTMMSWLIERPRPVPSPAGFVVKKGLNIFSFTSVGMPLPLSRMRISTACPRSLVVARRVGSNPELPISVLRL